MEDVRVALVLSAGGLRGAAHAGVLRRLVDAGVRLHAIVGVSAGAVVAAYYAAVGLDVDDLICDAHRFRGRHLLAHSANVRLGNRFNAQLGPRCGIIPARLLELERASFDCLHHGVQGLGIVCHDRRTNRPHYFATGFDRGVSLGDAVRASASIPWLFPPVIVECGATALELTDGGVSDAVPIGFARSAEIGATHVIVSDCRWIGRAQPTDASTVWIRTPMAGAGTLWTPRRGLASAVRSGEAAVTDEILRRISKWRS